MINHDKGTNRAFQVKVGKELRNIWWVSSGQGLYAKTKVYTDHDEQILISNDGVSIVAYDKNDATPAIQIHHALSNGKTPKTFAVKKGVLTVVNPDERDMTMADKLIDKNGMIIINNMSNVDYDKGSIQCAIYETITDHCW